MNNLQKLFIIQIHLFMMRNFQCKKTNFFNLFDLFYFRPLNHNNSSKRLTIYVYNQSIK
jgi:hypothetical protein